MSGQANTSQAEPQRSVIHKKRPSGRSIASRQSTNPGTGPKTEHPQALAEASQVAHARVSVFASAAASSPFGQPRNEPIAARRSTDRSCWRSIPTRPCQQAQHAIRLSSCDRQMRGGSMLAGWLTTRGLDRSGGEIVHSASELPVISASIEIRIWRAKRLARRRTSDRESPEIWGMVATE